MMLRISIQDAKGELMKGIVLNEGGGEGEMKNYIDVDKPLPCLICLLVMGM